jgi:hypothetical protein
LPARPVRGHDRRRSLVGADGQTAGHQVAHNDTDLVAGYEAGHPWPDAKYGAAALQAETKAKKAGANVPHGRKKRHSHNINCRGKVTPLDSACELTTPNFGNAVCAGTAEPQADKAVGATCTVTSRKIRDWLLSI